MRERKYLKVATLLCVLATINLVALSAGRCQTESLPEKDPIHVNSTSAANVDKVSDRVGPRVISGLTSSTNRNVIVVGFVGGFVKRDDAKHPEVQFAAYLRNRYPAIHAEVFGNHHGQKALDQIVRLLDTDHDGSLTSLEKARATIILYGHSWGASETVTFARKLGEMGIPVALIIQIDTIGKPGHRSSMIPPSVASAINFYQTGGPLHGRPEIVPADLARTKIIGNFRMTYENRPINCDNYSWYARVFNKPHHEIENDLRVWDEAASLVDSDLSGTTPMVETPSPSSSPYFKYLRRGFQADITAITPLEIATGTRKITADRISTNEGGGADDHSPETHTPAAGHATESVLSTARVHLF